MVRSTDRRNSTLHVKYVKAFVLSVRAGKANLPNSAIPGLFQYGQRRDLICDAGACPATFGCQCIACVHINRIDASSCAPRSIL